MALSASSASAQAQPGQAHVPLASEPRPPSGIGGIVVGSAALGIAGLNLVTMPLCFADFYPSEAEDACVILSAAFAATGVAVGVPSLVVGRNRRARYKEWRARQRPYAELLRGLRMDVGAGRLGVRLRASF